MNKDRIVSFTAGAVLLAGAAVYAWNGHHAWREEVARLDQAKLEMAQIQSDVAAMRQARPSVAPNAAPSWIQPADPQEPSAPARSDSGAPPLAPSERPKGPTVDEMRDAYEARFVGEPPDRSWSTDASEAARQLIVPKLPADSTLQSLECRSSMCRVETSYRDVDSYRGFLRSSMLSPDFKWPGAFMTSILRTDPNGQVVTVAYLARPGSTLPYSDEANP